MTIVDKSMNHGAKSSHQAIPAAGKWESELTTGVIGVPKRNSNLLLPFSEFGAATKSASFAVWMAAAVTSVKLETLSIKDRLEQMPQFTLGDILIRTKARAFNCGA